MIKLDIYPDEEDSFQIEASPEVLNRLHNVYRRSNRKYTARWHEKKKLFVVHLAYWPAHQSLFCNWTASVMATVELRGKLRDWNHRLNAAKNVETTNTIWKAPTRIPLRPYQETALQWLIQMRSGLLRLPTGSGKTPISIAYCVQRMLESSEKEPACLILTRRSLCRQWEREIEKFAPEEWAKTMVVRDPSAAKRKRLWDADGAFFVTNYDTLKADEKHVRSRFWTVLVGDEVQYAATPELRLTELLKAVPSKFRVAATATPIENDLDELFSIMEFVHPGILGNHDAFKKDYTVRDDFDAPRAYRLQLVRNELRQRISPFVFSGTKEELLPELPPLVEKRIELTMTPDQQKMYESVMTETEEFKEVLAREGLCVEPINTISKLIYLREIANDPITFDSHYNSDSAKFQAILEILMEAEENVLIFSGFKRMAMRIYNDISYWNHSGLANKWGLLYMDGNHTDSARETTVNIFNTRKPMILVATDCLKEGVNLPTARTVIHVDTAYNPATYQQRNGRAHRIGSTGQITVYSFVTVNTVEERIEVLVRAKKNLSDTVFGDEPNAISQKLTKNEIDWLVYGDEQSKTQSNNTVQNKKR